PKDNSIQVFAGVNSGWLTLQRSATSAWYWYGLSAKHLLKKDKGSLTLNMNNPFTRGIRQENIEEAPSFYTRTSSLYVNQAFRFTFEWRFGQLSAEGGKKGKKITNDDSGR
ncbi:MAG TPA: outer membrane beta-barrel protein, partial [Flavisolibacter sp.]|nr:outer membrane beta-barrel protein [Flavisolibacter sp.]